MEKLFSFKVGTICQEKAAWSIIFYHWIMPVSLKYCKLRKKRLVSGFLGFGIDLAGRNWRHDSVGDHNRGNRGYFILYFLRNFDNFDSIIFVKRADGQILTGPVAILRNSIHRRNTRSELSNFLIWLLTHVWNAVRLLKSKSEILGNFLELHIEFWQV